MCYIKRARFEYQKAIVKTKHFQAVTDEYSKDL